MGRRGDVNMVRVFVWLAAGAVIPAGVASPGIAAGAKAALAQTTEQSAANMVSRTTKAFNYRAAGGSTETLMAGTDLMRSASGTVKVEVKTNRTELEAKFTGLEDPTRFGLEYLTYVLWAISPQGRAVNLGEVVAKNGNAS